MPHPVIIVTRGATAYQLPILPFPGPDGKPGLYNLRERTVVGFAKPFPNSGLASEDTALAFKNEVQKPPFYVGHASNYDRSFIWDGDNILTVFGTLYPGPLVQQITATNFPATFTGLQFFEGISRVFVFGKGAAVGSEPVHPFTGSTANFGDGTLNADDADDVTEVTGMAQIQSTVYAIYLTRDAGTHMMASSTNGTAWTPIAELTLTSANDRTFGGFATQGPSVSPWVFIYTLVWNTAAGTEASGIIRPYWHSGTGNFTAMTGDAILGDNTAPRGFVEFPGPDGFMDFMISTKDRLYWADRSATAQSVVIKERLKYTYPRGSYTGKLVTDPDGKSCWFTDGSNVRRFFWTDTSGKFDAPHYGPGSQHELDPKYEGMPLAKQGDVTAIANSIINPNWLYCAIGGLAASRTNHIRILEKNTGRWSGDIYVGPTANLAIINMKETQEDDGVIRLLFAVEATAAGGTQGVSYFVDVPVHPEFASSYKFATSGFIESTWFDGGLISHQKGFYRTGLTAGGLTGVASTDERVDIQTSIDDGAYNTAQTVGAASTQIYGAWTDGSGAVGTGGAKIRQKLTLKRGTTNTNKPSVSSFFTEYEAFALKADGTPIRELQVRVSLDPNDFNGLPQAESAKDARDILDLLAANRPLLKIAIGQDAPVGSELKVRLITPYDQWRQVADVRDQNALPVDEAGYADLTFTEVR